MTEETKTPLEGGGVMQDRGDLRWLTDLIQEQEHVGHCGEGTLERKTREMHNARVQRVLAAITASQARQRELEAALVKINAIRNSIIGLQKPNWSEHIYPLVAALDEAGFEGMEYPEARANYGTMLERTNSAEQRQRELEEALRKARSELLELCEATQDECHAISERDTETKQGAFARGRRHEAKGIARAMVEVFHELLNSPAWEQGAKHQSQMPPEFRAEVDAELKGTWLGSLSPDDDEWFFDMDGRP